MTKAMGDVRVLLRLARERRAHHQSPLVVGVRSTPVIVSLVLLAIALYASR